MDVICNEFLAITLTPLAVLSVSMCVATKDKHKAMVYNADVKVSVADTFFQ